MGLGENFGERAKCMSISPESDSPLPCSPKALRVVAFVGGRGKTSTLRAYAEARLDTSFLNSPSIRANLSTKALGCDCASVGFGLEIIGNPNIPCLLISPILAIY